MSSANPFNHCLQQLPDGRGQFYSLLALKDPRVEKLPFSIRVLLECALRNCDEFNVKKNDVENILNWEKTAVQQTEVPFKPARVLLQDLTGVPAVVDLAALRDSMAALGGDPQKINPLVPVDLVIDHSVQVDSWGSTAAVEANEAKEYERNAERFSFLKWGSQSFTNLTIVPPGSGICHQVNLEYLARVVFDSSSESGGDKTQGPPMLYPDSVVGTDSHTTMIDGLGVVGWGVGGIEAEAVMLGQAISMVLPEVVGFRLVGQLGVAATATDLVLTITERLRRRGVVGKFVEFYGPGCQSLTLADRATIANMSPEYGATMGFFPVDEQSLEYLRQSGRDAKKIAVVEEYLRAQGLFRVYDGTQPDPVYTGEVIELDLASVEPSVSGPKRPQDLVLVSKMKEDFLNCITAPAGFKGFGFPKDALSKSKVLHYEGKDYTLSHGSVVIAAITSCTNTSNPSVMLGSALLAKKAYERGLSVKPYVKCSVAPGSGVVKEYFKNSGLLPYLEQLGFFLVGFGCTTCIGNSGDLHDAVSEAVSDGEIITSAVLSGNRNFEGRVHPLTTANYLMSPILVVAYALAGSVSIDLHKEPLGVDSNGKPVMLSEIWPSREELLAVESAVISPALFKSCYENIQSGNQRWKDLPVDQSTMFKWDESSTYVHHPPFFAGMKPQPEAVEDVTDAHCLLLMGDSVTTDHISPAGKISRESPAARFLQSKGITPINFNTYGARRGNDLIMARGTFANIRLINKMASKVGPIAKHVPSSEELSVFDAADRYMKEGKQLILIAGKEYGSGSSRDWAAKGPKLLGVRAVIAESFERIHRSNLLGMGLMPLQFLDGQSATSLGLTGDEEFSIPLSGGKMKVGQTITVTTKCGKKFDVRSRIDTEVELAYFQNGGILNYVLRKLSSK